MLSLEQLFSGGKQDLQGGVKTLEELFMPSQSNVPPQPDLSQIEPNKRPLQ